MLYFNELAGGSRNWPKYLLGSNISWGQEAYFLKMWVEKHPEGRPLYVSYSSPISLEELGIKSDGGVPTKPTAGWMVIDVNELFGKSGNYDWLKEEKEVEMIGYSLWIFHIEVDKALPEKDL